jgi:hypothetical protein
MRIPLLLHVLSASVLLTGCIQDASKSSDSSAIKTICNPMNLSYRFCLDEPSRREAADPVIVIFKDKYYLFASKSGGYWYSDDLCNWSFVTTPDLPLENYAPAAFVFEDHVYFMASTAPLPNTTLHRSADPAGGKWEIVNDDFPIKMTDPAFFADDDGRVYFYYGCSNVDPIMSVELNPTDRFNPTGKPVICFGGDPAEFGWEQTGDYNEMADAPWLEGAWVNKHNGIYYLQYAAPGTEYKSYCDGVYVSGNPLGPFTLQKSNPFSAKPEGFIAGAGHGATFRDKNGNWWHVATMSVSVKHKFERRLGLFPAYFDNDGILYTNTTFGDYPYIIPDSECKDPDQLRTGWMLLSYGKGSESSGELEGYPVSDAFDEDIRTYWSASTGNKGEWMSVDLGNEKVIRAIQVNFAENNSELFGREKVNCHQYIIEYSSDNHNWEILFDHSNETEDLTHRYEVLTNPLKTRYLRITNIRVPGGTFAISDFRVFGQSMGVIPAAVSAFRAVRDTADRRIVHLSWRKSENATGYNIRFGTQKDKLYRTYQVYSDTSLTIRSLNINESYCFAIDAFGESGVSKGINSEIVD